MIFNIPGTIYQYDLIVALDIENDPLKKYVKRHCNLTDTDIKALDDFAPSNRGRCVMLECGVTVIRLKTRDKYELLGTIAHEVFHFVTFVFYKVGIEYQLNVSDEAFAYMLGYYTKMVTRKLKL